MRTGARPYPASIPRAIFVLLFFCLLFTAFFSPALLAGRMLAPGDGQSFGIPAYYAPPTLWTHLLYAGHPAAADVQMMTWYPVTRLFSALGLSWNCLVIAAYVLASLFACGYVSSLTGSLRAGLLAGTIYGLSGFMVAHLSHANLIHTAAWLPLLVWALDRLRYGSSGRWWMVLSAAVACGALAGHPQVWIYALATAGAYALTFAGGAPQGRVRYIGEASLAGIAGLGLSAIQLVPAVELVRLGPRATTMSLADFASYALHPYQALCLVFPYLFGGSPQSLYRTPYLGDWNIGEMTGYVGLLPLMLAGVGVAAYWRERPARFWLGAGLVAALLVLGNATPLAALTYHIFPFNLFRAPARHFMETTFAASVLAGLGASALERRRVGGRALLAVALAAVTTVFASLALVIVFSRTLATAAVQDPPAWLRTLVPGNPALLVPLAVCLLGSGALLFWARCPSRRLGWALALLVLVVDLGSFGWFFEWRYSALRAGSIGPPAIARRYADLLSAENQRMLPIRGSIGGVDEIPPNLSRLWGVPSASGYGPLLLQRYADLLRMSANGDMLGGWAAETDRSLDILAVRYVFLPTPDLTPPPSTSEQGVVWADGDLPVTIGSGCGDPAPTSVSLSVTRPVRATTVHVVTALACSTEISDGVEVARVVLTDSAGVAQVRSLRAGQDTSEWAWECADVRPAVRHGRARVFASHRAARAAGGSCDGHSYVAAHPLSGEQAITRIDISWTGEPGSLRVFKITLEDAGSGTMHPVGFVPDLLARTARWRHVEDAGSASVYENLQAMPRVWLVPEVICLAPDEILAAILSSRLPDGRDFDPLRIALVEDPSAARRDDRDAMASAQVVSLRDGEMQVRTGSGAPAFLVSSDASYPGWHVTIDGEPAPLVQANYALRGVRVPAGDHTVRFHFRPPSVRWGGALTSVTLVMLLCAALAGRFGFGRGRAHVGASSAGPDERTAIPDDRRGRP